MSCSGQYFEPLPKALMATGLDCVFPERDLEQIPLKGFPFHWAGGRGEEVLEVCPFQSWER
jgi:hypothetical protein